MENTIQEMHDMITKLSVNVDDSYKKIDDLETEHSKQQTNVKMMEYRMDFRG